MVRAASSGKRVICESLDERNVWQHCRTAPMTCVLPCAGIRDHVVQAVELKFHCFFLMPVVDTFPTRLREELEQAYEEDLDEVFDVAAVRCALESRLRSLESELHQVFLGAPLACACKRGSWTA